MRPKGSGRRQQGAASLLIALVLLMSTTLITLSVARTQVTEILMAGNENWHSRLRLMAQSEWERATTDLTGAPQKLAWIPLGDDSMQVSRIMPGTGIEDVETTVTYHKSDSTSRVVSIQAVTGRRDGAGLTGRAGQGVLLLTVLSPLAEAAPPLVINGCLSTGTANIDIRPINSDRDNAGDAVWYVNSTPCQSFDTIDVHGGQLIKTPLHNTLWSILFSISPADYEQLAASELTLPAAQRRYWLAEPADLSAGKWTWSLGSADTPVVLVFPQATGCPRFAAGVHIFGFVFIDTACPDPIADVVVEITGTLAINGNTNNGNGDIQLNHIQIADSQQTRLSFPILRAVRIPGTWKDF